MKCIANAPIHYKLYSIYNLIQYLDCTKYVGGLRASTLFFRVYRTFYSAYDYLTEFLHLCQLNICFIAQLITFATVSRLRRKKYILIPGSGCGFKQQLTAAA